MDIFSTVYLTVHSATDVSSPVLLNIKSLRSTARPRCQVRFSWTFSQYGPHRVWDRSIPYTPSGRVYIRAVGLAQSSKRTLPFADRASPCVSTSVIRGCFSTCHTRQRQPFQRPLGTSPRYYGRQLSSPSRWWRRIACSWDSVDLFPKQFSLVASTWTMISVRERSWNHVRISLWSLQSECEWWRHNIHVVIVSRGDDRFVFIASLEFVVHDLIQISGRFLIKAPGGAENSRETPCLSFLYDQCDVFNSNGSCLVHHRSSWSDCTSACSRLNWNTHG